MSIFNICKILDNESQVANFYKDFIRETRIEFNSSFLLCSTYWHIVT